MLRRAVFFSALAALAYGFWISPDLKGIAAGVAVFLFGMLFLEQGFGQFAGGRLEKMLRGSTSSLPRSLGFGFASTAVMQSSSLVSVLTISFLSAGLIGLRAGIGIIFGANIGTTTGAWLMAGWGVKIKLAQFALPMLVFGIVMVLNKAKTVKGAGYILAGLGFLFLGIDFMKTGFEAMQNSIDLAQYSMGGIGGLLLFTLLGVIATVVMQSSHATLMLIIAGLASGQVTYENSLALAIGANIGTTITAILGALSAAAPGRRLAGAHLIFNVVTGLIALVFINQFMWSVDTVAGWVGIAPDNWTLKLAVFHTIFNVVGVIVMVPMIGYLVRFLEARVGGGSDSTRPHFLNEAVEALPDTAIRALYHETLHLFDNAFEILAHGVNLHRKDILSTRDLTVVVAESDEALELDIAAQYHAKVKVLYNEIIAFAARVQPNTTPAQAEAIYNIGNTCRNIARAVKLIGGVRANMAVHSRSENAHMRDEYNQLRRALAGVLRECYRLRPLPEYDDVLLGFAELDKQVADVDVLRRGNLDHLIREQLITSVEATSLMNDSGAIHDVIEQLVDSSKRLATMRTEVLAEFADELLLHDAPDGESPTLTGEYRRIVRPNGPKKED
jgi:phosphate:Na+ symporter